MPKMRNMNARRSRAVARRLFPISPAIGRSGGTEYSCPADYPELILLRRRSEVCCAYHLYVVRFATEGLKADMDAILQVLQERGVGIGIHFRPVHLHPYYKNKYGYRRGMYPVAEYAGDRVVSLPLFPSMTDAQIDHVISTVVEIVQELRM